MVVLNKIYTRTGDDGTSALGSGERRPKSDWRFEAIGTIDELNASLGTARLAIAPDLDAMVARIQNDLFDLGADLAVPQDESRQRERLRVVSAQVERLEAEIDALNDGLAPLTSFILPGGSPAAAALHISRTVARRAERVMTALNAAEPLNPAALTYVNRLSDFLFVASRVANDGGKGDVLWVPGENR
ncbi:cob(I)yrinic acid a,c-diamide adenosyltransferase [Bauldia sp.]|uniref:cob(I)yrinic acid a,c-diamide adenosyltransferase n=1 Tax=Bauldia sp. TaxID=2575872 RepID=UPI003BAA1B24